MALHIVTVATEEKFYFPYLKDTCAKQGVNLTVLGFGEKWGGYAWKFKKVIDFLASIPPNDIVCFVDGYDVICVRNLGQLPSEFMRIKERENCKIIIAEDGQVYGGVFNFIADGYYGRCNDQFINSGTYIGFASDVLEILKDARHKFPDETDDQKLITDYCSLKHDNFYIDAKREIFFAIVTSFREVCIPENTNPFFVHAAGCAFLTNILNARGYHNVDPFIKIELTKYFIQKAIGHITTFIKRQFLKIICIILMILLIIKLLY